MATPTIDDVRAAAARIEPWVHRTPLLSARRLSPSPDVQLLLKAELLQKTGSFKPRGAVNRVLTLDDESRAAGLVTVSAGNHAQGLAYAAGQLDVQCTVVMPESAPAAKVAATRGYGASVELVSDVTEAFARAEELADRGMTMAHPFDDPMVIAGQGTVGAEIIEDEPEPDVVVVPIGGGGLISGVSTAVKALHPGARVVGVEPELAATLSTALEAGQPVPIVPRSVADGLGAPIAGDLTIDIVGRLVDEIVIVDEAAIAGAMAVLAATAKLVAEPAGAAALAALQLGLVDVGPDATVVVVCSGGNVDMSRFAELVTGGGAA